MYTQSDVIDEGGCYGLQEFARRTGLKRKALRRARDAGLVIRYRHGRAFVLGRDWIEYLEKTEQADS
jgi:hypothetical protein